MKRTLLFIVLSVMLLGCAPAADFTAFNRRRPRSVLILPPLNDTTTIYAENKFLSTISRPIAEQGYYVFPIAIVDRMLRENGVVSPIEMRQVPYAKLREIFGADTLLDISIESWGTQYIVVSSVTVVRLRYRLIDLASGQELWSRDDEIRDGSNSSGNISNVLIGALSHAIQNADSDIEVGLAANLNQSVFADLPHGPRWVEDPQ